MSNFVLVLPMTPLSGQGIPPKPVYGGFMHTFYFIVHKMRCFLRIMLVMFRFVSREGPSRVPPCQNHLPHITFGSKCDLCLHFTIQILQQFVDLMDLYVNFKSKDYKRYFPVAMCLPLIHTTLQDMQNETTIAG